MGERVTVLSLSVSQSFSHSVTQQKADLEDGTLLKSETSINRLHWKLFPLKCQNFQKKIVFLGYTIVSYCW